MAHDLNMLHNAYKQNLSSAPTTRISRTHTFDPQKKTQQQKPTIIKNLSKPNIQTPAKKVIKNLSKPNIQTPAKKGSPSAVTRPKTAPTPTPTPKENKNNDSALIEQLKLDKESLINKIESLEKVYEEQLRSIRQENFTLQAKITQVTSTNVDRKNESISPKQREVNELEKLIDGYQVENEKLCKQIKQIEQQHKQIEQSMFNENEKLRQELIHTKMLMEQYQNSHMGTIKKQSSTIVLTNLVNNDNDKNNIFNENQQLKNEIIVLKNKLTTALDKEHKNEDDNTLRLVDQRRIKDLERQVKELELINRRRQQNSTTQVGMVLNPLDDRNQLEIKLNKAEEALRERQISEEKLLYELNILEEKYSLMKQMLSKNNGQSTINNDQFEKEFHDILNKNKNKNLTGQIHLRRENEQLINRRRQQNSTTQIGMILNPLDDRNQLEIKLNKAEEALRERQISEEKLLYELNILEEKYSLMKQMLSKNNEQSTINNDQFEKEFHDILNKNKNKNLTGQIHLRRENERLKNELEKLKTIQVPKPAKSLKRDLETIKLLRSDIERKNDELEKLRALYDAVNVQHKSLLAEREREKTRLAIMGSKPYQPDRFTQTLSSVETVHAENEQLKHLVEKLEHDSQQQYTELMHLRDDRQAAVVLAIREKDDEILRLRQQHKLELQTIINEMSTNTTETRISDLLRKIELQDATIIHLKKLTENTDENARELAILRVRDDELRSTVHRLEQELADARTYHTPEMKHFQELQNKINQLEQRWYKRDKIKKDYTNSLIKQHDLDTNNDVNKLHAIIKQKNQEIERFHIELDSMLELLKTLKFQQLLYN
ncbi:unnamed protein product [Rotaria sordida]|uniref:Centrosomal protein of 162 kDa n=1 Tax=Rotaria sordida TaxID=392033 RepID=A0A814TB88_9BILA|nr:unnamed protein product [Rotaria sordida]